MYRYFVLFLLGSSLFIGAYYLREAGIDKVVDLANPNQDVQLLTPDDVIGKYLCADVNGCKQDYEITLYPSGVAKLSEVKDGEDAHVVERGSWKFVSGGFISLSLEEKIEEGKDDVTYANPVAFLIQSVSTSTLAKFVYNTKLYPLITKPKFIKQDI